MINDATTNTEIKYIREDIHETALARIATLEAENTILHEDNERLLRQYGDEVSGLCDNERFKKICSLESQLGIAKSELKQLINGDRLYGYPTGPEWEKIIKQIRAALEAINGQGEKKWHHVEVDREEGGG